MRLKTIPPVPSIPSAITLGAAPALRSIISVPLVESVKKTRPFRSTATDSSTPLPA